MPVVPTLVALLMSWSFMTTAPSTPAHAAMADTLTVASVPAAHTLHLSDGTRVRLIGVDVPPLTYGPEMERWALRTSLDPSVLRSRARSAQAYAADVAEGQPVRLVQDRAFRDENHRTPDGALLAYVIILDDEGNDELMLNAHLLERGFGQARRDEYQEAEAFVRAEEKARDEGRGFWSREGTPQRQARPPR